MPTCPGYAGMQPAELPYRRRPMPSGPGLARTRVDTYHPLGHPLADQEETETVKSEIETNELGSEWKDHVRQHPAMCSIRRRGARPSHLGIHGLSH